MSTQVTIQEKVLDNYNGPVVVELSNSLDVVGLDDLTDFKDQITQIKDEAVSAADTASTAAQRAEAASNDVTNNTQAAKDAAAAAKVSETNAKTSETKAKTSETNADTSEANALSYKNAAKTSETNAKTSEINAGTSEANALSYKNAAKTSETNAKDSETKAKVSETNAKDSETKAKTSETNAKVSEDNSLASETNAKTSETNAKDSETKAKVSETNAKDSETKAKTSETNAKDSETKAKTSETNAKASEVASKASEVSASDSADRAAAAASAYAVISKAEFDARRNANKELYAGSGFVEWGKQWEASSVGNVNQGIWMDALVSNSCYIGRGTDENAYGTSKSNVPIVNVDGVTHVIYGTVMCEHSGRNRILFPPAPNGTKTYDSATGVVTQHASVEAAFASETATNKVITTRKDLVFLESFYETIDEKDWVCPLGNTQYGSNSWNDITLTNTLIAQGYSAFGEWDKETKGYGAKWSTLSEDNRTKFLSDPRNNIYYDPETKKLIQVRYRIRVVEGVNDSLYIQGGGNIRPELGNHIRPSVAETYYNAQGQKTVPTTWAGFVSGASYRGATHSKFSGGSTNDTHRWEVDGDKDMTISADGEVYLIPICSVQRLNQGLYHKEFNEFGCARGHHQNVNFPLWYDSFIQQRVHSVGDCFKPSLWWDDYTPSTFNSGSIAGSTVKAGRPTNDPYQFFDAIYAGLVEDLRLSAHKQDTNKLLEDSMRKAVSGEMRGKGKIPFTWVSETVAQISDVNKSAIDIKYIDAVKLKDSYKYVSIFNTRNDLVVSNAPIVALQDRDGDSWLRYEEQKFADRKIGEVYKVILTKDLTPELDNLPWTDIIGSPANIAATFPNGVVGQWIPQIPDGSINKFGLNTKATAASFTLYTTDNGTNWSATPMPLNQVTNQMEGTIAANQVRLVQYPTLSNFTEKADSSKVVGQVGRVNAAISSVVKYGNRFIPSLIGKVGTHQYGIFASDAIAGHVVIEANGWMDSGASNVTHSHDTRPTSVWNYTYQVTSNNAGVKALYTLTEKNGLLYLQLHGRELKYSGGNWGDNSQIPIVEGESTMTDDNGETVKTFCHHSMIPLGIASYTDSNQSKE